LLSLCAPFPDFLAKLTQSDFPPPLFSQVFTSRAGAAVTDEDAPLFLSAFAA